MNADRFLAYYEQVADAPDVVARLRRFILDLAVRGKLVPQDADDEPVSGLLKRRRIPFSSTWPFELPRTWAWVRVGDVSEARLGKMLDKNKNKGVPRPYLRNINVRWFDFDLSNLLMMPFEADELEEFALQAGDVLICEGGEPGRAAVWDDRSRNIYFQKALHRVRFTAFVDPTFFVNALKSSVDDGRLAESFTGAGIMHFTGRSLSSYLFPLPPLTEQHRIVAKVDELMGLCDRLEAARADRETVRDRLAAASLARLSAPETVEPTSPAPETNRAFSHHTRFVLDNLPALTARPDQINVVRQTILSLAVRGKLVPQNASDEPAIKLMERLRRAQAAAYNREGLRSRPPIRNIDRADMWFDFPSSWELASFDDVFVIAGGVAKGQKIASDEAIELPYLRVANVQRGCLDLSVIKNLTIRATDKQRYELRQGDILMTEGGDWDKLGRAAIWNEEIEDCIHQNHVFRVRPPSSDILPAWVIVYVNSLLGRSYFENASKQTTNLASINMTQLRGCPLPLPPLAEQHRIVAKVDELMALCDKLEASLTAAADTRRRLLDALLAEALAPDEDRLLEAAE